MTLSLASSALGQSDMYPPWMVPTPTPTWAPPDWYPTNNPYDPYNPPYYPVVTPTPSPTPNSYSYAYVLVADGSYAHVYSETNTGGQVHGSYTNGTSVKVYSRGSEWSLVEVNGVTGYMQTRYLNFSGAVVTPTPDGSTGIYGYIVLPSGTTSIPVYADARESSSRLTTLGNGTRVRILRQGSDWSTIEVNGLTGYILSRFLGSSGNNPSGVTYMYVRSVAGISTVPLYLEANTGSRVLGTYANGTRVQLISQSGGWSTVDIGNYRGYMQTAYLSYSYDGSTSNPGGGGGSGYATVKNQNASSKLNLRAKASTSSSTLGRYGNGTSVKVLEYGNEWCRVEVSGKTGYMMTRYLAFSSTATNNPYYPGATATPSFGGGGGTATVSNKNPRDVLNMRAQPSTSSSIIGRYGNGTQVRVLDRGSTWCQVEIGGKTGYMVTSNLSFSSSPSPTYNPYPTPTPAPGTPGGTRAAVVTSKTINLYSMPSTASISLAIFNNGTPVEIVSYGTTWSQVVIRGQRGYVMTKHIALT